MVGRSIEDSNVIQLWHVFHVYNKQLPNEPINDTQLVIGNGDSTTLDVQIHTFSVKRAVTIL